MSPAVVATVPEVIALVPAGNGGLVVRAAGHPVTVWPFAAGTWPGKHDPAVRRQAAELLVRVRGALAHAPAPVAPVSRTPQGPGEDLADPVLDAWLAEHAWDKPQPLHGGYYRGNTLAVGGRIAALLDWDDTLVGPVERKAAESAWEWRACLDTGVVDGAQEFLAAYAAAGGAVVDDTAFRQYARARMRAEITPGSLRPSMRCARSPFLPPDHAHMRPVPLIMEPLGMSMAHQGGKVPRQT